MVYDYLGIFTPLFLHMAISGLVVILGGARLDSTAATTLVAAVVIPVAGWMYWRDGKRWPWEKKSWSNQNIGSEKKNRPNQNIGAQGNNQSDQNIRSKGNNQSDQDIRSKGNICPDQNIRSEKKNWPNQNIRAQGNNQSDQNIGSKGNNLPDQSIGSKILFGVGCFLAGAVLNVLWSGVLNWLQIGAHFSNQTQEELLSGQIVLQIVGLGILVPVSEELIFRGLIYRRMRRLMPLGAAVAGSALLFALYHGNMIQIIFAFPMGIVLTLAYEKGKLFVFPLLFHMGANFTAIFMNFF